MPHYPALAKKAGAAGLGPDTFNGPCDVVVAPNGEAALVLRNLAPAGSGRTYEAWIAAEGAPEPAGLFEGGGAVAIPLDRPVPKGATVMVTKEPAGGRKSPSSQPFAIVRNAAQS